MDIAELQATLQADPALMVAAGVVGLGLLGLIAEAVFSSPRKVRAKSPIVVSADAPSHRLAAAEPLQRMPVSHPAPAPAFVQPQAVEEPAPPPAPVFAPEPPKDPLAEHLRFFETLAGSLSVDENSPATLAALHANLGSDVFMERMQLAAKGWRPDGFAEGARALTLKAEGTAPDAVSERVLAGYEHLKAGQVREALEAFLAAIENAKTEADADPSSPWPHAWSGAAWRGLALIAEESGDVQATLAGLKVGYQSMVNAFDLAVQASQRG